MALTTPQCPLPVGRGRGKEGKNGNGPFQGPSIVPMASPLYERAEVNTAACSNLLKPSDEHTGAGGRVYHKASAAVQDVEYFKWLPSERGRVLALLVGLTQRMWALRDPRLQNRINRV